MIRQYAENALACIRGGDVETGLSWLKGFVESHTNVFTRAMLEAALDGKWEAVIASLEHQLKWCL